MQVIQKKFLLELLLPAFLDCMPIQCLWWALILIIMPGLKKKQARRWEEAWVDLLQDIRLGMIAVRPDFSGALPKAHWEPRGHDSSLLHWSDFSPYHAPACDNKRFRQQLSLSPRTTQNPARRCRCAHHVKSLDQIPEYRRRRRECLTGIYHMMK